MVSLDQRIFIEKAIRESSKANGLAMLFNKQTIIIPDKALGETEVLYYEFLTALEKNNKTSFSQSYSEIVGRKVLSDQPLIYDNYFLFVITVGVKKFNLSQDWLKQVFALRTTLNEPEKSITTSLTNLLEHNYLSTDGIPSIVLAGLLLCESESINSNLVKNSLDANRKVTEYLERDFFLSLVFLFTNDYIIQISISEESIKLKHFEQTFLRRVRILQTLLYVIVVLGIIAAWLYLVDRYPSIKELANNIGIALQILGISLLAFALNVVRFGFGKIIRLFFGYREKSNEKN